VPPGILERAKKIRPYRLMYPSIVFNPERIDMAEQTVATHVHSSGQVWLHKVKVALHHLVEDRGRWCRPKIGVEDLDLDVALVSG
jgi:hypothetical protein